MDYMYGFTVYGVVYTQPHTPQGARAAAGSNGTTSQKNVCSGVRKRLTAVCCMLNQDTYMCEDTLYMCAPLYVCAPVRVRLSLTHTSAPMCFLEKSRAELAICHWKPLLKI